MKLDLLERQANALRNDLLYICTKIQRGKAMTLQTHYANFRSMARRINQLIETQSAAPK